MAIYHLSVKTISRSAGRSATAAAAYRAGCKIADEQTGEIHDYTRKGGVVSAELHLPENAPAWATDRAALWNAAEVAETRKNSTVAREFEIALPAELTQEQRRELANELAREIVKKHGCGVDVCIHEPNTKGDQQNHHAHILLTTRRLSSDGFGEKTRELDERTSGAVDHWRDRFAQLQNAALERAGHSARVDHRSLENQGIERAPTVHLGVAATGIERRTGEPSEIRTQHDQRTAEAKKKADAIKAESRPRELEIKNLEQSIEHEKQKAESERSFAAVQQPIRAGEERDKRSAAQVAAPPREKPLNINREEFIRRLAEKKTAPPVQLSSLELMKKLNEQSQDIWNVSNEEIEVTKKALIEAHKRELLAQPAYAGRTSSDIEKLAKLRKGFLIDKPTNQPEQSLQRFDTIFSDPEKLAEVLKAGEQSAEKNNAQKSRDDGMER
jgi:MobA/MobL family